MKYEDEIPEAQQITLNQFRLLPGSRLRRRWGNDHYDAVVREVWSANPEYVLGGPDAKDAGIITWTEKGRTECEAFLGGEHQPVKIRLRKSMWAVIQLYLPGYGDSNPLKATLYTYDIEELVAKGDLIIVRR